MNFTKTFLLLLLVTVNFSKENLTKVDIENQKRKNFATIFGINSPQILSEYLMKSVYESNQTQLEVSNLKVIEEGEHKVSVSVDLYWRNIQNFGFHNTGEKNAKIDIYLEKLTKSPRSWTITQQGDFTFQYPKEAHPIPPRYKGNDWLTNEVHTQQDAKLLSFLKETTQKLTHAQVRVFEFNKVFDAEKDSLKFKVNLYWFDPMHFGYHSTREEGAVITFKLDPESGKPVSWELKSGVFTYDYPGEEHPTPPRNSLEKWFEFI